MTASSVASVKIEREQIEQLARALRLELRVNESGAALFRRCLKHVSELATEDPLDRLDRAVVEFEDSNTTALLEALGTFRRALGGLGEADTTEETERATAPPDVH